MSGTTLSDADVGIGAPVVLNDADVGIKPRTPTIASTVAAPAVGFNRTLADMAGAPVDLANWAARGLEKARRATSNIPAPWDEDAPASTPFGGSESIKRGLGYIGANPDDKPPQSTAEKYLQTGGSGLAAAMLPEMALAGLTRAGITTLAPRVAEIARTMFGRGESLPATALNSTIGATSSASGEAASDAVPDEWAALKPYVNLAGGIGGGMLTALPLGIVKGARAVKDYVAPLGTEGRQRLAGDKLLQAADDPARLRSLLEAPPEPLVPESKPTLFQQSGDMGIGSLERRAESLNPPPFLQNRANQNSARVGALNSLQEAGSPADVAAHVRDTLQRLDEHSAGFLQNATDEAAKKAAALGGDQAPEVYADAIRKHLQGAKDAAREQRAALYNKIDPDGTLNVVATPVRDAATEMRQSIDPMSKPPAGEEASIMDAMTGAPDVVPFKSLTELDKRITAAMAEERKAAGESPVWGRLTRLKGAVVGAINNGVENQAQHEARAVASGEMAPEATIFGRLQQEVSDFAAKPSAEARTAQAGTGVGESPTDAGPQPAPSIHRSSGTEVQAGRGSANAPRDQGVPGGEGPLEPNFDPAAAERLSAAKQAHAEYAKTYRAGPVGDVLRTAGYEGQYRTPNATVLAKFFPPGDAGHDAATAFRNAAGSDAVPVMQDYIAASLKKAAQRPDGTIDPAKFATWRKAHEGGLRAFPELAPVFEDAAKASEAMDAAAIQRRDAITSYQKGVAGRLLNVSDPADVKRTVGGIFGSKNAVAQMGDLAHAVSSDPDASAGLRRAIAEYISDRFVSNTEAATSEQNLMKSDQFQTFLKQSRPALAKVFRPDELASMDAIAADLHRANRSIRSTALPGRSTTAQDILPTLNSQGHSQIRLLANILEAPGAFYAGLQGHGIASGVALGSAAIAHRIVAAMRNSGLQKINDLVTEALLNPDIARDLVNKSSNRAPLNAGLADKIGKATLYGTLASQPREERASGGRVQFDHVAAARALMAAAQRAKRQHGEATKTLLHTPDSAIAQALSVANAHI